MQKKFALVALVVLGVLAQAAPGMSANRSSCPTKGHLPTGVIGFSDGPR